MCEPKQGGVAGVLAHQGKEDVIGKEEVTGVSHQGREEVIVEALVLGLRFSLRCSAQCSVLGFKVLGVKVSDLKKTGKGLERVLGCSHTEVDTSSCKERTLSQVLINIITAPLPPSSSHPLIPSDL